MRDVRRMGQHKRGQGCKTAEQHLHIDELQRKAAPEPQRLSLAVAVPVFPHPARDHAPSQPENIDRARPDHPGRQPRQCARQGERRAAAEQHDGQKSGAHTRQQRGAAAQTVRSRAAQGQDIVRSGRDGGNQRITQKRTEHDERHDILLAFFQNSADSSIEIANIFAFIIQ